MTRPSWILHPSAVVGGIAGAVIVAAGVVLGRADVAIMGVPIVIAVVWGTLALPSGAPTAACGSDMILHVKDDGAGSRLAPAVWRIRIVSAGHRDFHGVMTTPREPVAVTLHSGRTGPAPEVVIDGDCHGPWLLSSCLATRIIATPPVVLPTHTWVGPVPQSRRLRGLTGPMDSPRPGDGFEFRDVHLLAPGEPLRRIQWAAMARSAGEDGVWVQGSYATGEAVAILVIDSRDDVGPDLHAWGGYIPTRVDEPTSLDLARHAGATIARSLIDRGARVGLTDVASNRRLLAPSAGHRHLRRVIYALALTHPIGSPRHRVRPPQIPKDAVVYFFSTLLDDQSLMVASALSTQGHRVIVIDTLPDVRPVAEVGLELAWRVMDLERRTRIDSLTRQHIPVVAWSGPARQHALTQLTALTGTDRGQR